MKSLTKFALYSFASIASILLGGFTLQCLWSWFVVTQFGLAPLSIPVAIGLKMLVSYVTAQIDLSGGEKVENPANFILAVNTGIALVSLLGGYIVHLFM